MLIFVLPFFCRAQADQIQVFLKVVGLVKHAVTSTIPFEMCATAKTVEVKKQPLPCNVSHSIYVYIEAFSPSFSFCKGKVSLD